MKLLNCICKNKIKFDNVVKRLHVPLYNFNTNKRMSYSVTHFGAAVFGFLKPSAVGSKT